MFSPSDYNDAVPQFTNGNYANTPLNPLYVEEPDAVNYNRGSEPLQTLPAQWWNWLCNKITSKLNNLNIYVKNIFDELTGLLSVVGETPDATEEEVTTEQLKDMFSTKYPQYLIENKKFVKSVNSKTADNTGSIVITGSDVVYKNGSEDSIAKSIDDINTTIHNTSDIPIKNSSIFFTAGGMYDFTIGSKSAISWLSKIFGRLLCRKFTVCTGTPTYGFSKYANNDNIIVGAYTFSGTPPFADANMYWSEDGKDWTMCTGIDNQSVRKIIFSNNIFVAATANGLWWSEDGKDWTKCTGDCSTYSINFVINSNGLFVASSVHGNWWSEDGKEWVQESDSINNYGTNTICYFKNLFVCGSGHGIWWSENGKNWNQGIGIGSSVATSNLANRDNICVCGVSNSGMWWTEDGKTWTQGTGSLTTFNITSSYYAYGLFLCSCMYQNQGRGSFYSEDGKSWTQITNLTGASNTFFYANGLWLASSTIACSISEDGKNWSVLLSGANFTQPFFCRGIWLISNVESVRWSSIEQVINDGYFVD